jgi:transcriptional regulator with XRE-family HTH domain
MTQTDNAKPIHQGRNVKRFRELIGMKQEALADLLGHEWSQKKVSIIESREVLEDSMIEELAKALKVPADAIKYLSEDAVFNIINNTFHDFHNSAANLGNFNCALNPSDEVKQLIIDKEELTKALLKEKDEKIVTLERLDELNKALLKEKDEKIILLQKLLDSSK